MTAKGETQISDRDDPVASPTKGAVALYRFFNAQGRLLYVGISSVPAQRWAFHSLHAATTWWPQAALKQVQWFSQRSDAAAAELRAIRTEAPLYNCGGAPSPLRELAPGEKLCPRENRQRFHEATAQATAPWTAQPGTPWQWFNTDVAIAVTLANDMRQGHLSVGDQLPSISLLVNRFGVSTSTIRRAIRLLREDGVVVEQGSGSATRYFLAEPIDDADWRPPPLPDGRDALDALLAAIRAGAISLSRAADQIGLHLSIVRGWGQRHPTLQRLIDDALKRGRNRQGRNPDSTTPR